MKIIFQFLIMFFVGLFSFTAGWFLKEKYQDEKIVKISPFLKTSISQVKKNKKDFSIQEIDIKEDSKIENPEPIQEESKGSENKQTKREIELTKKYHEMNTKEFSKIINNQSIFSRKGKYSFLVNVFNDEEQTLSYFKKTKDKFPNWNLFIKHKSDLFRVYLGPFKTKETAKDFIESVPEPSPFPNYLLETVSIK